MQKDVAGLREVEAKQEREKISHINTRSAIDKALESISTYETSVLIDLGCGSSNSLIEFCKKTQNRSGIGIDMDSDIVYEARKNVEKAELGGKIKIIQNNIIGVEEWANAIPKDAQLNFMMSGILHEFFRFGEHWVISYLQKFHNFFKGARVFLIEFDALSPEEIRQEQDARRKVYTAFYQFYHPLSNQGMPQKRAVWERVMKEAGWDVKHIYHAENYFLVYECEL